MPVDLLNGLMERRPHRDASIAADRTIGPERISGEPCITNPRIGGACPTSEAFHVIIPAVQKFPEPSPWLAADAFEQTNIRSRPPSKPETSSTSTVRAAAPARSHQRTCQRSHNRCKPTERHRCAGVRRANHQATDQSHERGQEALGQVRTHRQDPVLQPGGRPYPAAPAPHGRGRQRRVLAFQWARHKC